MKRIYLLILTIMIFSISFANATFVENDIRYISAERARELWDVKINFKERSGVIEIISPADKKMIYMQIGSPNIQTEKSFNYFFLNVDGFKLHGNRKTEHVPIMLDGEIYLPSDILYEIALQENEYDVIVVGSEPEGIASAVSAARTGAKVLLLGKEDSPGGLLVHGMLNTIDMNYTPDGILLTQGIFKEFYSEIGNKESFDVKEAEQAFISLIEKEVNITYNSNVQNINPIVEGKTIKGLNVYLGTENKVYYGKRIIDATPDGDICALAGVPYYIGMEDINIVDTQMAVTLIFRVSGVNWDLLKEDVKRYIEETGDTNCGINESSAWAFGKWCYNKYTPVYPNMKLRGLNIGRQNDGTVLINALQILNVDGLNEEAEEAAKRQGIKEIDNVMRHLKSKLNSFENATLDGVADELYIRETRHIRGEYTVKASELLAGNVFNDSIAAGSYAIDIQSTSVNNNGMVVGAPKTYTIPLRSSIPLEIENLFIVGKAASYSSVAAGSIRVVPVGMAVGESCGTAAVYSIRKDMTPRELAYSNENIKKLQSILREQNVYLPEGNENSVIAGNTYYNELVEMIDLGIAGGGYNNDFKLNELITKASFYNMTIQTMKRNGISGNYERIKLLYDIYNSTENINEDDVTFMIMDILGEDINRITIYQLRKRAEELQLFTKLVNRTPDGLITKGEAYNIIINLCKKLEKI